MNYRNLVVLIFCQLISATGTIVMVTLGGIIGAELSGNPAWATLPVSLWVLALAASTVPSALLMRRIGRPVGFSLGALTACGAVLIALWALRSSSFTVFLLAAAVFGINLAFTQQYRFAAIESATPRHAGRAVSMVLLGAIGGALLGPTILSLTSGSGDALPYEGTMITLAALYFISAAAALLLRRTDASAAAAAMIPSRTLSAIARQPIFIVAVLGAAVGYGVMVFVMTATPLSMHTVDGFTLEETASVIRAHVLGMYLPSFVSGYLIDRFGVVRIMSIGAVTLLLSLTVGMGGHSYNEYWAALVLLGVGWNFLFVGGTTLLTYTYSAAERFRAQALNEFCVFGTAAAGSLLAGTIMHAFGWFTTVVVPVPALVVILASLFIVRREALVETARTARVDSSHAS